MWLRNYVFYTGMSVDTVQIYRNVSTDITNISPLSLSMYMPMTNDTVVHGLCSGYFKQYVYTGTVHTCNLHYMQHTRTHVYIHTYMHMYVLRV